MGINSSFYICSENKLSVSDRKDAVISDGIKVNWMPDKGILFEAYNKDEVHYITFDYNINFDIIKFYLLPSTSYYWGTRQKQDSISGCLIKVYYSLDGTNYIEINNTNAISINSYFGISDADYSPSQYAWNCGSNASVLFLKMNTKIIGCKKIKFVFSWEDSSIANWGVTEIEVKETKNFKIYNFNLDTENKILENTLNETNITMDIHDIDYSLYNFLDVNNEIFGYIEKDGIKTYCSNLIIKEANINVEKKILNLVIGYYSDFYFTNKVNYNTPILFKKSYYTISHVIELLLLEANIPQYFVNFYHGYYTPAVYYPNIEMSIIDELNDFLKSNLNMQLKRNFQNIFTIYNQGSETYQIITKSADNYLNFPNGYTEDNNRLNPIFLAKNVFYNSKFLNLFFNIDIILKDTNAKFFTTVTKTSLKRKTKRFLFFKMVDKRIDFEKEIQELKTETGNERINNYQLLDFPYNKRIITSILDNYHDKNNIIISAEAITASCITVPDPEHSGMYKCEVDLYLPTREQSSLIEITQLERIDFNYKDKRGEVTFSYNIPDSFLIYGKSYLRYNGDGSLYYFYIRSKLIADTSGYFMLEVAFMNRNKTTNEEKIIWRDMVAASQTNGAFLRDRKLAEYSGEIFGICKMTFWKKKGISPPVGYDYRDIEINGLRLSGIAMKLGIDAFPLTNALDVNIKDWSETESYNLLSNNNNISSEVYYQLRDNIYSLGEKQYNLAELQYPATGSLNFIYILKNIYPYSSYGKLWYIKSITHTNVLDYSPSIDYINKFSKQLIYTKTFENLDYEHLITKLNYYKNVLINENKTENISLSIPTGESFYYEINFKDEYLILGKTIFDIKINDKTYSFFIGSGTINTPEGIYFDYEFKNDLYKITIYITNKMNIQLEGELYVFYKIFYFKGQQFIYDFTDLQKKYGIKEYELISGQLMLHTQVYYLFQFLNQFYNIKKVFNNSDIIFDGDFNLLLNNYCIRIEDRYLNKHYTFIPYYYNHNINADNLISETSMRGKLINEENIV